MRRKGFAQTKMGTSFALAIELTGLKPSELLQMNSLEREFTLALANELEKWRWQNWQKLFGGK